MQQVEPLGVGGHQPVLDAVVHHLHEVTRTGRAAVQVAPFGVAGFADASWGALGGVHTRCQGGQDGLDVGNRIGVAAHHQAVAPVAEHAARGAGVEQVDAPLGKRRRSRGSRR